MRDDGAVAINGFEKLNLKQPTISYIFLSHLIGTLMFSKITSWKVYTRWVVYTSTEHLYQYYLIKIILKTINIDFEERIWYTKYVF